MGPLPAICLRKSMNRLSLTVLKSHSNCKYFEKRFFNSFTKQSARSTGCHGGGYQAPGQISSRRYSSDQDKYLETPTDNHRDPWKILKTDLSQFGATGEYVKEIIPNEADVLIIGGGVTGLSVAYWLKQNSMGTCKVVVVERDPTYTRASTVLSVGGIRQQFSIPENIQMSLFGAEFLRNIKEHLSVLDLDPPDVQFTPQGYLFLATAAGADQLRNNYSIQTDNKAVVELMDRAALKKRFPWINVEDIDVGTYGLQNEGVFDPWLLLAALKAKCLSQGVEFVTGELTDIKLNHIPPGRKMSMQPTLESAQVKNKADGKMHSIRPVYFVNCAGPWAQDVGKMAGIGVGEGPLEIPIPVEPRKRYVYMFHCPDGPGLDTPMLIDPSGVYLRREGMAGHYICGVSPQDDSEEPCISTLDVDYQLFQDKIWPMLAHRVPVCETLKIGYEDKENESYSVDINIFKDTILPLLENRIPAFKKSQVKSAWAGYYDYNTHDQNLIIGNHPVYRNFYMACGSSGHGLQHSIAIGRAMSELILEQKFVTLDLSAFSFDRVLYGEKMCEENIV